MVQLKDLRICKSLHLDQIEYQSSPVPARRGSHTFTEMGQASKPAFFKNLNSGIHRNIYIFKVIKEIYVRATMCRWCHQYRRNYETYIDRVVFDFDGLQKRYKKGNRKRN